MSNPYGPPGGDRQWGTPPWSGQQHGTLPWATQPGVHQPAQGYPQPPQWGEYSWSHPPAQGAPQPAPQQAAPYGTAQYGTAPYAPSGQDGFTPTTPTTAEQAPHFGYGPQQPGGFGDPAVEGRRRRSPWPWILSGVGALVVVVLVLGFVVPGFFYRTVLDARAVQKGVERILVDSYDIQGVESVRCPSGQPVRKGTTFTCQVTIDGRHAEVEITIRNSEGSYEVSHPR